MINQFQHFPCIAVQVIINQVFKTRDFFDSQNIKRGHREIIFDEIHPKLDISRLLLHYDNEINYSTCPFQFLFVMSSS